MTVSKAEIEKYLLDVFGAINNGRYQIEPRQKNKEIFQNFVFTEEDAKGVLLSLTPDDFSDMVKNDHPEHPEEVLYIFGKEIILLPKFGGRERKIPLYIKINKLANHYVVVISLHKQEYPLSYQFK